MVTNYIPDKGDIVSVNMNPLVGKEITKTRPALVVSPKAYNSLVGLVLLLPITSEDGIKEAKSFMISINTKFAKGYIMCDQIKSFDLKERVQKKLGKLADKQIKEAISRLAVLLR